MIRFQCGKCGKKIGITAEHAGRKVKCPQCQAVLLVPEEEGAAAQVIRPPEPSQSTPAGGNVFRYEDREAKHQFTVGDADLIEETTDHIERHFGAIESVYHELISDLVHIDVHLIKPTEEHPFNVLVTTGLSEQPMVVPDGAEEFAFAELYILLPADWPLDQEDFEEEANYWPIRWLKILARFPHQYETWLGPLHTMPNGDPPEPFAENTKLCGIVLTPTDIFGDAASAMHRSDGNTVNFYCVLPIYKEEMDFKLNVGAEALLEKMAAAGIETVVDVGRKNVCRKRFGWF